MGIHFSTFHKPNTASEQSIEHCVESCKLYEYIAVQWAQSCFATVKNLIQCYPKLISWNGELVMFSTCFTACISNYTNRKLGLTKVTHDKIFQICFECLMLLTSNLDNADSIIWSIFVYLCTKLFKYVFIANLYPHVFRWCGPTFSKFSIYSIRPAVAADIFHLQNYRVCSHRLQRKATWYVCGKGEVATHN